MAWKQTRPGTYADDGGHVVFRIGAHGDVQDALGRFWAAVYRDGTPVTSSDMQLPYEGIHRFKTLRAATWHLEVHDNAGD